MVFPGVQKSTWTWDEAARAWYLHRFYDFQPDLNVAQPRGAAGDPPHHGLLARSSASTASAWTPCPSSSATKGRTCRAPARTTTCCASCASSSRGGAATRSCWPRRTSSPRVDMQYFGDDGDRSADDVQLPRQPAPVLGARHRARRAARARARGHAQRARRRHSGRIFCATTTRSISAACPTARAKNASTRSAPTRTCSSTIAASAAGWRRCSRAIAVAGSWRTRSCSRCPARPSSATATSSAWATICRCPSATPSARRCSGPTTRTAASRAPTRPSCRSSTAGRTATSGINEADQRRDAQSMLNWTERIIRMRKECPEIGWGNFDVVHTRRAVGAGAALPVAQQRAVGGPQPRRRVGRGRRCTSPTTSSNLSSFDDSRPGAEAATRSRSSRTAIAGSASAATTTCRAAAITKSSARGLARPPDALTIALDHRRAR